MSTGRQLGYFGEPFDPPCGRCDRCRAAEAAVAAAIGAAEDGADPAVSPDHAPLGVGDRVAHATFGAGTVTGLEPDRVTVAFDGVGYRTIVLEATENGTLIASED